MLYIEPLGTIDAWELSVFDINTLDESKLDPIQICSQHGLQHQKNEIVCLIWQAAYTWRRVNKTEYISSLQMWLWNDS